MNFAYLDAHDVITPGPELLAPIPHTLDESWKNFETLLEKFKMEYIGSLNDLSQLRAELNMKQEDVFQARAVIEGIQDQELKTCIESIVEDYELKEGIADMMVRTRDLMGKTEAQGRVLKDTNAERYAPFICFVCMERPIDTFIDPCGHVICGPCWARTTNKAHCPGCRTPGVQPKKIFTLS